MKLLPDEEFNKKVDERVEILLKRYLKGSAFTDRKLTDTPTDNLAVVNRRYVNLNGLLATRPTSSVATLGQHYFATDTNISMTYNGTNWVNGVGSVVAAG